VFFDRLYLSNELIFSLALKKHLKASIQEIKKNIKSNFDNFYVFKGGGQVGLPMFGRNIEAYLCFGRIKRLTGVYE
jgi:hypothetical protein